MRRAARRNGGRIRPWEFRGKILDCDTPSYLSAPSRNVSAGERAGKRPSGAVKACDHSAPECSSAAFMESVKSTRMADRNVLLRASSTTSCFNFGVRDCPANFSLTSVCGTYSPGLSTASEALVGTGGISRGFESLLERGMN